MTQNTYDMLHTDSTITSQTFNIEMIVSIFIYYLMNFNFKTIRISSIHKPIGLETHCAIWNQNRMIQMVYNIEWKWFSYFNSLLLLFLHTLITLNWFIYSIWISNDSITSLIEFQNHHSYYSFFHTNLWIWTRIDEWYECTYLLFTYSFLSSS